MSFTEMRFLQRLRFLDYRQLPSITHKLSSCLYNTNLLLGCKDKQVTWGQFCYSFIRSTEIQYGNCSFGTLSHNQNSIEYSPRAMASSEFQCDNQDTKSRNSTEGVTEHRIGENVSKKDKIKFLVNTLLDLKDCKDDVYGALDAWVAWEQNFPISSLKLVLRVLEEKQQHHRVVQVIKWILSKGQGTTMGTYKQLIHALDMDHRAEEAHRFWVKKIGNDLHSVPWELCKCMMSIYYRNNKLERLVKLFKNLEAYDRKPPEKSVVQKVADAYELLGLLEEKERLLEKYKTTFTETWRGRSKKAMKASLKKQEKQEKSGKRNGKGTSDDHSTPANSLNNDTA